MKQKKYFCTLFDRGYLIKGIAMVNSLLENCSDGHIFILCMDEYVYSYLKRISLSSVTLISIDKFETKQLKELKKTRTVAEYCWTLSPCLPSYVLDNDPEVDLITYLDADLYFYDCVEPIFRELDGYSIAIIEHRFAPQLLDRLVNGRFCVQWVSFRRDLEGLSCLARWKGQCLEWCYYRLEEGKMGDQKYLDEWPNLYNKCRIIEAVGAGIAPWNYGNYEIGFKNNKIIIDDDPLIFYHFHQFNINPYGDFDRISRFYSERWPVPESIYMTYEKALLQIMDEIREYDHDFLVQRNWISRVIERAMKAIKI